MAGHLCLQCTVALCLGDWYLDKTRIWSGDNQTMNHQPLRGYFREELLFDVWLRDRSRDGEIFSWIDESHYRCGFSYNMRFVQSPSLVGGYGLFACGTETLNLPSNNLLLLIFSFASLTQVPRMILNENVDIDLNALPELSQMRTAQIC